MTEIKQAIPSRVYNAATGGHVCGAEDIDFGSKVVHLVPSKTFEEQVTTANTIYVIHDDFTLSSNISIPANCVLEFDGGSIKGDVSYKNGLRIINKNSSYCIIDGRFLPYSSTSYLANDAIETKWFKSSIATIEDESESIKLALQTIQGSYNVRTLLFEERTYNLSSIGDSFYRNIDMDFNGATINLVGTHIDYFFKVNMNDDGNKHIRMPMHIHNGRFCMNPEDWTNRDYASIFSIGENATYDVVDCLLSDLKFVYVGCVNSIIIGNYCAGLYIQRCNFQEPSGFSCIRLNYNMPNSFVWHAIVRDCNINGSSGVRYGIYSRAGSLYVEDCALQGISDCAIYFEMISGTYPTEVINIANCYFEFNGCCIRNSSGSEMLSTINVSSCIADLAYGPFMKVTDYAYGVIESCMFTNATGQTLYGPIMKDIPTATYNRCEIVVQDNNVNFTLTNIAGFSEGAILEDSLLGIWGNNYGDSNRRPKLNNGCMYFDTSLTPPRPIWKTVNGWVDATGTPV